MSVHSKLIGSAIAASLLTAAALWSGACAQAQTAAPKPPAAAPAPAAPAAPAAAPAAQAPGPQRVELVATQPEWTKVCGKIPETNKEVCYTTRDFGQVQDGQPVLALAVYDVKGEDKRQIRALLPLALLLKPGFRLSVDAGAPVNGSFAVCFPNGCFAEVEVPGTFLATIKKGTMMNIAVRNQGNLEVTFAVPLKDFAKGFDGAAIDPKVLEDQQKQLSDELQKRAVEERKKLETQGAAPAPGAPAAPKP